MKAAVSDCAFQLGVCAWMILVILVSMWQSSAVNVRIKAIEAQIVELKEQLK